MKLFIERTPLLRVLNHLSSVVDRRVTVSILGNVLIRAECQDGAGRLSLAATDLDLELLETVPAQVVAPGETTVSARTLYNIVRKLPDGAQIEIDHGGGKHGSDCGVRAGKSRFTVTTIKADDFPVMSAGDLPHSFVLPAADMRYLIDRTRFAMSTEEVRYHLNGLYLHPAEDATRGDGFHLRGVATDGHRLARADVALPEGAAKMPGVIVPRKTIIEFRKLIDGVAGDIAVEVGNRKIRFTANAAVMTSKLIDGTYPDYGHVIPVGNDKMIEVVRSDLTSAIDRVSTIVTDRTRAVKMTFGDGVLSIAASSHEQGYAVEDLDAVYRGSEIVVGFNSRYLLDIASQIGGDNLRFDLMDGGAPAVIRDAADDAALYVLMPMRV